MKHPALTRLFAIVLTVLCLTMLLAGLGSAGSALSDRRKGREEHQRLSARIDEYRQIREELAGSEGYRQADLALREQQEQHDEQASQHRIDLAIYTATRSGIQSGMEALDQAEAALQQGKAQFEQGRAAFQEQEALFWEGYNQFQEAKRQLTESRQTLEMAEGALAGLRAQVEQGRELSSILESEDEDARRELSVAAYDGLLQTLDQATQLYTALKDQGGVSPEQVELLVTMLSQQEGADLSWLPEDFAWEGISAESLQELEDQVVEATGLTVEEIRAAIQEQRDAVADMDENAPITEEQFAALQAGYGQSREQIQAVLDAMDGKLAEYETQVAEARAQLDEAQAQVDAMDEMMEQGRAAIEQARAALDLVEGQMNLGAQGLADGRSQLQQREAELEEQAEALRQEKQELDSEAEELSEKAAEAERLKTLEQREASVRLMLMDWEGIQTRADGGMDVLTAAEEYAAALQQEVERMANDRLLAAGLMILGGLASFAGIPAAFERTKSRFWFLAPVLLCLGCAVGAEVLCRILGRGDSYSALGAAIFALVQLALVIPRKKTA